MRTLYKVTIWDGKIESEWFAWGTTREQAIRKAKDNHIATYNRESFEEVHAVKA